MVRQFKSSADIIFALSYVYLILSLILAGSLLVTYGGEKNVVGIIIGVMVIVQAFIVQALLKLVGLFVKNYIDRNL